MVLANRSRRSILPQRPPARALTPWIAGIEVGLFVLISGGAGVALLWFVAQGEASPASYPTANPSPTLSRPVPGPAAAKPCIDRSVEATTTTSACLRIN